LATTLYSLGKLYERTHPSEEAVNSYMEALLIRRELVKTNPIAYSPDLAAILNGLGTLYESEGRKEDASREG